MAMALDNEVLDLLIDLFNDIQTIVDELKERPDYDPEFVAEEVGKALADVDYDPDVFEGCDGEEDVLLQPADPGCRAAVRKGCP